MECAKCSMITTSGLSIGSIYFWKIYAVMFLFTLYFKVTLSISSILITVAVFASNNGYELTRTLLGIKSSR